MGNPLVRFCEGPGCNRGMAEILWHRRETRRQTEKTNVSLQPRESSVYSTNGTSIKNEISSTYDYGEDLKF
jgi:hypothetical protein